MQVQVVDDDVEGDHAALKVHGEHKGLHDEPGAGQVVPGEGVARQHGEEGAHHGAAHRVDDPAGKEPSEGGRGHGVEDLGKCKHAGPAHSDI